MAYPSRDTWAFRNATEGFYFYPRLSSIQITQSNPDDPSTFSCEVVDEDNALVFNAEDRVVVWYGSTRVFAGHVKRRGRTQVAETGPRMYTLECQDYTAKLDDSVITRKKDRRKETIKKRLRWIHSKVNFQCYLDLSGVPDDELIPAQNYHSLTTHDAFAQVADEKRLFMHMDFGTDGDWRPTLHFYRTITAEAVFDLDDTAPDYESTFPYREFIDWDDSMQLATMVYVVPEEEKDSAWVISEDARDEHGWHQASFSDASIKGPDGVERIGGRFLDEFDQPLTEGFAVVHEPRLQSGQKVHIVNDLWGLDYDRYITSVLMTAVDPNTEAEDATEDNEEGAYLRSEITFSDRRKTRRRPNRPSQGDTAIPTDPVTTVDFPTVVEPPTQSDGDPISLVMAGTMSHGRHHFTLAYTDPHWSSVAATAQWLRSHLDGYAAWTNQPYFTTCDNLNNHFGGFTENEVWMKATMPDPIPADAAGIVFDMPINDGSGGVQGPSYGSVGAVEIVALGYQPTTMRQGTVLGVGYKGQTVTVTVPAGILPAAGEDLYVGYRTRWHAQSIANPFEHACGFSWPFMSDEYEMSASGAPWLGYSGRVSVGDSAVSGTWKVWDGAAPDLGSTSDGRAIQDAGYTGAPDAWSMGPDGITVEDDEPASKGIYLVGSEDDDSEAAGAWSDGFWGAKVYFTTTGTGSTTDPGTREVSLATTGDGENSTGVVHLGDASRDAGISVTGVDTDYEEFAIVEGTRYVAMFDTRNEFEVRGKIWAAADGEPTEWVVFSDLNGTEDLQDRIDLWLRAGNDGTTHGVTVERIESVDGTAPGQRVVGQFLGYAGGDEKRFLVPDQFRGGSLRVYINGIFTPHIAEDGAGTWFVLDWWPTAGSAVHVDYVGAGGIDDG